MVGRFATTPLMKYFPPTRLLGLYGAVNVFLIGLAIMRPGMVGACAIVASSFFLSIMFPTIFALGLKGLGPNTKLAGSLLVMAIVGGASSPHTRLDCEADWEHSSRLLCSSVWVRRRISVWFSRPASAP